MNNHGRRRAFGTAFRAFPSVLRGFARESALGFPGEKSKEREQAAGPVRHCPTYEGKVVSILAGMFAVRLLVSRGELERQNGGDAKPLATFALGATNRLGDVTLRWLDGFDLQGPPLPTKAVAAFQADVASTVFDVLAVDAQTPTFDEADFWADVFRGLGDTDDSGQVIRGLSAVVLDRVDELRHVLRVMAGGHVLDLAAH